MRQAGYTLLLILAVAMSVGGIAAAGDASSSSSPYEVYYTYTEYNTSFINSGNPGGWTDPQALLNELRGYIDQRHCAYDNHYVWVYTDIPDPSNPQYFLNRIDGYSKMHTVVLPSYVRITLEWDWRKWPPIRYRVYTGLRLVSGVVMPGSIRSRDLMHQLYDNTRMRFFILATPFGAVTNTSAWAAIARLYFPFPVDKGDDAASALIASGAYIVITFDFARTVNPAALQYFNLPYENGYYLLDFVTKFFRIAADEPIYVPRQGFYPSIIYAVSIVINPGNGVDSVVQPGFIRLGGPLIITPNNVYPPIFWEETYPR